MQIQNDTEETGLVPVSGTGGFIGLITQAAHLITRDGKRDLATIQKELIHELEAIGQEGAATWYYTLSFENRRDGTTVDVEGPSIRAAEAVQRAYGFLLTAGSILEDRGSEIIVAGACLDLMKGNIVMRQRRVPREQWNRDRKRVVPVPAHKLERDIPAAISKSLRDAIFASVPASLKNHVFSRSKGLAAQGKLNLTPLLASFSRLGVTQAQLETLLGHPIEQVTKDEYVRLIGLGTAIRDGETTIEKAFQDAPIGANGGARKPLDERDDVDPALAGKIYGIGAIRGHNRSQVEAITAKLEATGLSVQQIFERMAADAGIVVGKPEQAKSPASVSENHQRQDAAAVEGQENAFDQKAFGY